MVGVTRRNKYGVVQKRKYVKKYSCEILMGQDLRILGSLFDQFLIDKLKAQTRVNLTLSTSIAVRR